MNEAMLNVAYEPLSCESGNDYVLPIRVFSQTPRNVPYVHLSFQNKTHQVVDISLSLGTCWLVI